MTSILAVRDLHVSYGPVRALRGVSLAVRAGEMVAIVGANGAGKSTLLKTIIAALRPRSGGVEFEGNTMVGKPMEWAVRHGICLVPEGRQPFADMTVEENLVLGAYTRLGWRTTPAVRATLRQVFDLFPRLGERRRQAAGTLSGGEQQMLVIGRAFMGQPRLLLCDEPCLGLAPLLVKEIMRTLRTLCDSGITVVLADQNARAALDLADRAYVLETGQVVLSGPSEQLRANPAVVDAYLGAG